ncbi:MAG TPA: branched-chain amino acid ABC transporter permease [Rectinemataceae bacterium]|nr:branched-chain amino acid ABC transporter permease [Rectinemataceae bacterium]
MGTVLQTILDQVFSTYIQQILVLVGINLIAVLGLSILTGFTGLFSFGHAGFMAIGAYVAAIFTARLHLPFALAIVAGGLSAALVSVLIGRLTLKLKGDYFCIATMGFGEAVRIVLNNVNYVGGARGWESLPLLTNIWMVLVLDIIFVVVTWNLINSRQGRNMIAVREEELAAQMAGINVFGHKMIALVTSAAFAGVAGALMANFLQFLRPTMFNMAKSTDLTIMVIFGGLGSISGSIVGTILLVSLPEIFRNFAQWRLVIYGLAVIIIMVGRPQGVMGGFELTVSGVRKSMAARRARQALEAETRAAERGGAA